MHINRSLFSTAKLQIVAVATKILGYSARFCDEWRVIRSSFL